MSQPCHSETRKAPSVRRHVAAGSRCRPASPALPPQQALSRRFFRSVALIESEEGVERQKEPKCFARLRHGYTYAERLTKRQMQSIPPRSRREEAPARRRDSSAARDAQRQKAGRIARAAKRRLQHATTHHEKIFPTRRRLRSPAPPPQRRKKQTNVKRATSKEDIFHLPDIEGTARR